MKILIKLCYPYVENIKVFAIGYLASLFILLMFIPINNYLETIYSNTDIVNFPADIVYSETDTTCTGCEKSYTSSLQVASPTNLGNIDNQIDLSQLTPIDDTSDQIFNTILVGINQDITLQSFGVVESQNSEIINQIAVENRPYGVRKILVGNYPTAKGQVLLPETYALKIANDNNYTSYSQLLGTEINISLDNVEYNLTIVGVYAGENNLIVDSRQDTPTSGASFITFDDEQSAKQFVENNPQTISSKANSVNYSNYSKIVAIILASGLFVSLTVRHLSSCYRLRKVHVNSLSNIYIFIVPLLPLVVVAFIFWIK